MKTTNKTKATKATKKNFWRTLNEDKIEYQPQEDFYLYDLYTNITPVIQEQ